ncbi:hypothetical protein EV426DRAFT_711734 [Tirmania nivea]|nr:hypothetical protein EV426DRAFT_711734 [Tirmania nivea]
MTVLRAPTPRATRGAASDSSSTDKQGNSHITLPDATRDAEVATLIASNQSRPTEQLTDVSDCEEDNDDVKFAFQTLVSACPKDDTMRAEWFYYLRGHQTLQHLFLDSLPHEKCTMHRPLGAEILESGLSQVPAKVEAGKGRNPDSTAFGNINRSTNGRDIDLRTDDNRYWNPDHSSPAAARPGRHTHTDTQIMQVKERGTTSNIIKASTPTSSTPTRAQAIVLHGAPTKHKPGQMRRWIEEDNKDVEVMGSETA